MKANDSPGGSSTYIILGATLAGENPPSSSVMSWWCPKDELVLPQVIGPGGSSSKGFKFNKGRGDHRMRRRGIRIFTRIQIKLEGGIYILVA